MKWLIKLNAVLAFILILAGAASATVTLSVVDVTDDDPYLNVQHGTQFSVLIKVDDGTGLTGVQFDLSYDPAMASLVLSDVNLNCGFDVSATGLDTEGSIVVCNESVSGTLRVGIVLASESREQLLGPLGAGEATLAEIFFMAGHSGGASGLSLSNVILGDLSANQIPSTTADASVNVIPAGAVTLNLLNPATGTPADQVPINVVRGNSVSFNIDLNSGDYSVVSTGNDISYDNTVFTNPRATAGPAAIAAGKGVSTSTPSPGLFRVGVLGLNVNVIANGVVATVTFDVVSSAPAGYYWFGNTPESSDAGGGGLPTYGSNAWVNVLECVICIQKHASSPYHDVSDNPFVIGGKDLSYTIEYTNFGSVTATNVVVKETIPTGTTVSATDGGTYNSSTGEVTWSIASLAAGMSGDVSFTVTVSSVLTDRSTVSNSTYSIDSDQTDPYSGAPVATTVRNPSEIVQLDLSDGEGAQGRTGSIEITLLSGLHDVASVGTDIGYDPSTLLNFTCTINPAIGPGTSVNKDCSTSNPSFGVFRIGILGLNQTVIPDGLLATISFDVASSATCDSITSLSNTPSPASTPGGAEIVDTFGTGAEVTITCGPSVASITPILSTKFGGCPIVVGGTGFESGAIVTIGGTAARDIIFDSESQIRAKTPPLSAPMGSAPVPMDVVVTNLDGQSSDPSTDGVTFTATWPGDTRSSQGVGFHDGRVSIPEVQTVINMYLTGLNIKPEADSNCNAAVSIPEVQQSINSYLTLP